MELFRKSINWTVTDRNDGVFSKFYLFPSAGSLPLLSASVINTQLPHCHSPCQLLRPQPFYSTFQGNVTKVRPIPPLFFSPPQYPILFTPIVPYFFLLEDPKSLFLLSAQMLLISSIWPTVCPTPHIRPITTIKNLGFLAFTMRKHVLHRQIFKILIIHLYFLGHAVSGFSSS